MKIRADAITALPNGSRIEVNGRQYMRVTDLYPWNDLIVNLATGELYPWSRLFWMEDEVELLHKL